MYTLDKIEDDQGILWILLDIRHKKLFTINDLWRNHSTLKEGEEISKALSDKVMYIGT